MVTGWNVNVIEFAALKNCSLKELDVEKTDFSKME